MPEEFTAQLRYATLPIPLRPIAIHYWFVIFDPETQERERWEVWQWANRCPTSWGHIHKNLMDPDSGVGGGPRHIQCEWRGEAARRILSILKNPQNYPYYSRYWLWPGPNSNTFAAWVLRQAGIVCDFDPRAIGKDFHGRFGCCLKRDQQCFRLETPFLGFLRSKATRLEFHFLGLTFGFASHPFRIKTPLGYFPMNRTFSHPTGSIK